MSTTTYRQMFWRSPSGRIHSLRSCSGGAPVNRMRKVQLTRAEFDARTLHGPIDSSRCRCATWSERREAAYREAAEGKGGDPFAGFPR
jgi:hypothetical protein